MGGSKPGRIRIKVRQSFTLPTVAKQLQSQTDLLRRKKLFAGAEISIEHPVVRSDPGGVQMPKKYALMAEDVYNMEVRPDDVWIVTYPKCGTTWTQELVWQVVNGVDFGPDRPNHHERSPFLEVSSLLPGEIVRREDPLPQWLIEDAEDYGDPRQTDGFFLFSSFLQKFCASGCSGTAWPGWKI